MDIRRIVFKLSLLVLLVASVVSSCKKDDQPVENTYYVSKQFEVQYKQDYIKGLIDIVSLQVPEAAQIKPFISSDVSVYKIIYKTTIDGNEINASGLICVPVTAGEYPVLSFQNGTNTVNANAPSESPQNIDYQSIELMASLGFVVVIADYPGFGESSQIVHPYLIKEPTVRSLTDLLYAVHETGANEFPGVTIKNEHYLLGYSQGGWATLALHKALEQDNPDLHLSGSACGAGPYNTLLLFENMVDQATYPMPVYLAYIVNAYTSYHQFTNPVTDIFNQPYASKVSTLFNGMLTSAQINDQLTTSIPGLLTPDFISGYKTLSKYSGVIDALTANSIPAWQTGKPVLFLHGGSDTQVNPISTENIYNEMLAAGTAPSLISKVIVPGVDHSDGIVPCMVKGVLFLNNLKNSNN
jgi:pimeloyl-ACP methyl ester carboxylesterase